jgi:hypothetical protein
VKAVDFDSVPPTVVIETVIVPGVPGGVLAVIDMGDVTVTVVAELPPIVTVLDPVKPEPTIVTVVPPLVGPAAGVTRVIDGAAT